MDIDGERGVGIVDPSVDFEEERRARRAGKPPQRKYKVAIYAIYLLFIKAPHQPAAEEVTFWENYKKENNVPENTNNFTPTLKPQPVPASELAHVDSDLSEDEKSEKIPKVRSFRRGNGSTVSVIFIFHLIV